MIKETNKEQTLRYLLFKGKQDEWTMWSAKFMSQVRKKKYTHILTGKQKVTFEDEANKTYEEKALEKLNDGIRQLNYVDGQQDSVAIGRTKTLF